MQRNQSNLLQSEVECFFYIREAHMHEYGIICKIYIYSGSVMCKIEIKLSTSIRNSMEKMMSIRMQKHELQTECFSIIFMQKTKLPFSIPNDFWNTRTLLYCSALSALGTIHSSATLGEWIPPYGVACNAIAVPS